MVKLTALLLAGMVLAACGDSSSCGPMKSSNTSLILANKGCTQDTDCALVFMACGLAGECGAGVNVSIVKQLQSNSDNWNAECPDSSKFCPHCPSPPTTATCNQGMCACDGGCDI